MNTSDSRKVENRTCLWVSQGSLRASIGYKIVQFIKILRGRERNEEGEESGRLHYRWAHHA
jgi:hypothetical protein